MREGDSPSRLVTIYYNDVFVSEEPNEVYANCPYVNVSIMDAIEYADRMIENKDWDAYCIPELCNHEVKFTEDGLGEYKDADYQAMLDTLDVAMDEFSQIYNHSTSNEFREYYEMHMNQLDNIITLINKLK